MIVSIKNLRLRTIVGIYDWEKKKEQEITINLRVTFDGEKAAKTDDINATINYKSLRNKIIEHIENKDFNLVERIASEIADIALSLSLAEKVWVEVDKPGALRLTDSVSITVERSKEPK